MSWTPERIEKQRELAKDLVAQGKFGGAGRGQGRPRNPRASETVADRISKEGQAIFDRLMEILTEGTDSNSILAIREMRAFEDTERKIQDQDEQVEIDSMKHDDLVALTIGMILQLGDKGVIPREFIEGTAEDITEDRPSELSETASDSS